MSAFGGIRNADRPRYKESVMSTLYGEVLGFLKGEGLVKGKEYETKVKEIFECSHKIIWLDQYNKDFQITVFFNSLQMSIEMGTCIKIDGKPDRNGVIFRKKIQDLRYNISTGSELELTEGSREEFDQLFTAFKAEFRKLEKDY